jgi:uncharacterized iron-regulated membrane protein
VRLHAWTGLVAGPLLLVLGLSGTTLVFRSELEDVLAPSPRLASAAPARSLDSVRSAALLPHPGAEARALRVPAAPGRPYRVEVSRGGQRIDVDVDPATLRVVASRAPERSVFAAVQSLHAAFHAGRAAAVVVGLLGLWLVVEGVSGLSLYGASVKPPAGSRRRASRTVHRVLGAVSLTAGVLLGLTGALLGFGGALSGSGSTAPASSPSAALEHLDGVAARVERASPGARIVAIVGEPDDIVRVDVRPAAGEARTIRIARPTGAIIVTAVGMAPPTGWDVVRRLHAGDFPGWLVRSLYAAFGLALAVLAMTGFVIAARRHSSKVLT